MTPTDPRPDPPRTSSSGYDLTPPPAGEFDRLAASLTPEERRVILHQGTEPPFCGGLLANKGSGVYHCRLCDLPLFRSAAKFESGTGWPSFYEPFDREHVAVRRDTSHGMVRDEIVCGRCGGHLGHVFPDGPRPTGLRYCLNSASLRFAADGTGRTAVPVPSDDRRGGDGRPHAVSRSRMTGPPAAADGER